MRRGGEPFHASMSCSEAIAADGAALGFVATIRDISERKRHENELQRQATRDGLTGLLNRTAFLERLRDAVAAAAGRRPPADPRPAGHRPLQGDQRPPRPSRRRPRPRRDDGAPARPGPRRRPPRPRRRRGVRLDPARQQRRRRAFGGRARAPGDRGVRARRRRSRHRLRRPLRARRRPRPRGALPARRRRAVPREGARAQPQRPPHAAVVTGRRSPSGTPRPPATV